MAGTEQFSVMTLLKARDLTGATLAKASGRMNAFAARSARAMARVNAGFRATDAAIGRVLTRATLLGAGAVLLGGHAISAGADFEEAMSGIAAVTLQPREALAGLEAQARELGRTTKFTAAEAAAAMETMARAGFTTSQIMSGVPGILSAAAASGMEMAEVSEHVSAIMKGMALDAGDAARVADVLALASSRTKSTIGSLGESMRSVSPIAKQFGFSLEDAVAMAAKMQDVGIDASEAGNSIKTMLTKLTAPTPKAAAIMKKAGVSFIDSFGNMKPPKELFEQAAKLRESFKGNADSVKAFSELVGLRGQKALMVLGDMFADVNDEGKTLTEVLEDAEGTAQKMAAVKMDNLRGDLTLLSSAVDGVYQGMFDLEKGPLRAVVKGTTDWVSANQDLISSRMGQFVADLATNLPKIADRALLIGKIFLGYKAISWTIGAVTLATKGWAIATGWAASAQALLAAKTAASTVGMGGLGVASVTTGGAIKMAMLGALPAIAAVAGAIASLALAYNRWEALDQDLKGSGGIVGTYKKAVAAKEKERIKITKGPDKGKFRQGGWFDVTIDDMFRAHDEALNEAARREAKQRAAGYSTTEGLAERAKREGLDQPQDMTSLLAAIQSQMTDAQRMQTDAAAGSRFDPQAFAAWAGAPIPGMTPEASKTQVDVIIHDKTGAAEATATSSGPTRTTVQTKRSGDL